jgi:hypothetical protein
MVDIFLKDCIEYEEWSIDPGNSRRPGPVYLPVVFADLDEDVVTV